MLARPRALIDDDPLMRILFVAAAGVPACERFAETKAPHGERCSPACSFFSVPGIDVYVCKATGRIHLCGEEMCEDAMEHHGQQICRTTAVVLQSSQFVFQDDRRVAASVHVPSAWTARVKETRRSDVFLAEIRRRVECAYLIIRHVHDSRFRADLERAKLASAAAHAEKKLVSVIRQVLKTSTTVAEGFMDITVKIATASALRNDTQEKKDRDEAMLRELAAASVYYWYRCMWHGPAGAHYKFADHVIAFVFLSKDEHQSVVPYWPGATDFPTEKTLDKLAPNRMTAADSFLRERIIQTEADVPHFCPSLARWQGDLCRRGDASFAIHDQFADRVSASTSTQQRVADDCDESGDDHAMHE